MEITKEMAVISLRPNVEAWASRGVLTNQDIVREQLRLKALPLSDQKKIRRSAHPVDPGLLADLVEELTNRLLIVEGKVK